MIWHDRKVLEASLAKYPEENDKGWVYEVLRVIDGVPVFSSEHLDRYEKALQNTQTKKLYSKNTLKKAFFELIDKSKKKEGNIRLQTEIGSGLAQIGFVPHHYPTEKDYERGVSTATVKLSRSQPNIKTWNESVRVFCDKFTRVNNIFEVLLVDEGGFLTEGSRSNIFGMKDGTLITPPAKRVLPGITRQIILKIAEELRIPIKEEAIHKEEIFSFHSFFLSGTSPGILPIHSIDEFRFSCNSSTCDSLKTAYSEEVNESIKKEKKYYKSL